MALGVCLLGAAAPVWAQGDCTKFFQPPTVGQVSWHVDAHWSPPGVPAPSDVACIYENGPYEVRVTQPVTIAGLDLDAAGPDAPSLKIVATDFTLNGLGHLAGSTKLKVNDGAVLATDGGGSLEVHSQLVIEGGTVAVDVDLYGHLNWWGPSSLTGYLTTHAGSVIEVEAPMTAAHLTVANGFSNHGSLLFNNAVQQSLTVAAGTLVNGEGGVIGSHPTTGSTVEAPELRAEIDNRGVVSVDGVDLRIARDGSHHLNAAVGTIQVAGGELLIDLAGVTEVPSNFTNYGTTTVAGGGSIRVNGSAGVTEVPSNFTNYGTTTVASGGSIRVNGSAGVGESSTMTAVNHGSWVIHEGGLIEIVGAVFETTASGRLSGGGLLDVDQAAAAVFAGELSPGLSTGIFDVEGSLGLLGDALVAIEIGGTTAGAGFDRLALTGTLAADGELSASLLKSYQPSQGDRFPILTFSQLAGWFETILLPPLPNSLTWFVDVQPSEVALEVLCSGTDLGVATAPDRDPVSVGYEMVYRVTVVNHSTVTATHLVVDIPLPAELLFRADLSSTECSLVGGAVECTRPELSPSASWQLDVGVEAVMTGTVASTASVAAWQCDTFAGNDQATALVEVVAAAPCDANYDLAVDSDDLEPSVGHIFGEDAPGNPDCRLGGGITADDLAAIIVEGIRY
ncbi:MAG TPA: DUF11 domain-containing protein [Candidatus Sulfomarinibacteraceae bacterium]|nr:DUF11 domain-containing protein [Candidatus Sulfomarinibacteraceae bacterium]